MPTLPIWLAAHGVLVGIAALVLLGMDSRTGPVLVFAVGPFVVGLALRWMDRRSAPSA